MNSVKKQMNSVEEKKYYGEKELIKFLGIKYNFENEKNHKYPYWLKLEDLQFMWGRIIIPKGNIQEIILAKIQDREYKGKRELRMLIEQPFKVINSENHKGRIGIISVEVGLTFRYDKEFKYGDIKHSLEEVCYYIEKNATLVNNFYFIEDDKVFEFMSEYVIDNQWWIGRDHTYSSVLFDFKDQKEE